MAASQLYIPIWTYSNRKGYDGRKTVSILYIPIWTYSNVKCYRKKPQQDILYIPIWTYSNIAASGNVTPAVSSLHSNLDIF